MFLHACRLEIPHPLTGQSLELRAGLPPECTRILDLLEKDT
jgi:23S rRNA pseudouridine955/2504/2580 synthase